MSTRLFTSNATVKYIFSYNEQLKLGSKLICGWISSDEIDVLMCEDTFKVGPDIVKLPYRTHSTPSKYSSKKSNKKSGVHFYREAVKNY